MMGLMSDGMHGLEFEPGVAFMSEELFRKKNVLLQIPLCHIVSKEINDEFRPQW